MFDFLICLPLILVGLVILGAIGKIAWPYILRNFV